MRKFGFFLSAGLLMFAAVALVDGLHAQQKGGGGFGGFGGGGGAQSPLTLLNNKDVRKELDLTDEQIEKLPAEVQAAIARVLSEKQLKRFKQIQLQQRGNNAFKDDAVQKQLGLSAEQKKNIGEILETSSKEIGELTKGGFGGFGKGKGGAGGTTEKLEKIRTDARERILSALTKAQRKTWAEMTGEEFKMTTGFGGFGGFGKGKTDPKKDTPKDQ